MTLVKNSTPYLGIEILPIHFPTVRIISQQALPLLSIYITTIFYAQFAIHVLVQRYGIIFICRGFEFTSNTFLKVRNVCVPQMHLMFRCSSTYTNCTYLAAAACF